MPTHPRLLALLATLGIARSFVAFAQQEPLEVTEKSSGIIQMTAATLSTNPAEVFLQFGESRGAYRNGLKIRSHSFPNVCAAGIDIEPSCLFYTGDCVACGSDPNAQPGDISCFCRKQDPAWSTSDLLTMLPDGLSEDLDLALVSDHDGDGKFNATLYAEQNANPGNSDQMHVYQLTRGLARTDWEDILGGPNGDYNDMLFYIMGRDCSLEQQQFNSFPFMTVTEAGAGFYCTDICEPQIQDCQTPGAFTLGPVAQRSDLAFAAHVTLDREVGEGDRESRGRLIVVTLAVFGGVGRAGERIAICPELRLTNVDANRDYHATSWGRDPDTCASIPMDGTPVCSPQTRTDVDVWLSLSRDQYYAPGCLGSRLGPGDEIQLQSPHASQQTGQQCSLAMPHIETYEISLAELGAALGGSYVDIKNWPEVSILQRINGLKITLVSGLQPDPFYCPSGVNVMTDFAPAREPALGVVQQTFINDVPGALNYTESIRL